MSKQICTERIKTVPQRGTIHPITKLGKVALETVGVEYTGFPVVGSAEGPVVYASTDAVVVGAFAVVYEHFLSENYGNLKRKQKEEGYECMAGAVEGVNIQRVYQHAISAFKAYLNELFSKSGKVTDELVFQLCRGSESIHKLHILGEILTLGGFLKGLGLTHKVVPQTKKDEYQLTPSENSRLCSTMAKTVFVWDIYHGDKKLCRVHFRKGWEPEKIRNLPSPKCTVFLWGTCCHFENCVEGDIVVPIISVLYDVVTGILNSKPEEKYKNFFADTRVIWNPTAQLYSQQCIEQAIKQGVKFCGNRKPSYAVFDECVKQNVHLQTSTVFTVKKDQKTFTKL